MLPKFLMLGFVIFAISFGINLGITQGWDIQAILSTVAGVAGFFVWMLGMALEGLYVIAKEFSKREG